MKRILASVALSLILAASAFATSASKVHSNAGAAVEQCSCCAEPCCPCCEVNGSDSSCCCESR